MLGFDGRDCIIMHFFLVSKNCSVFQIGTIPLEMNMLIGHFGMVMRKWSYILYHYTVYS